MTQHLLTTIGGIPIYWDGEAITFVAGMTIDADGANGQGGSGHAAYHPDGSPPGLDYLANAGHPGNWWALVTENGHASGEPVIQSPTDPAPGFYISTTSLQHKEKDRKDPSCYIDSESVPFVVVPSSLIPLVAPIFLGCKALAEHLDSGEQCEAVAGDVGPGGHAGEGSIALAHALGIPSSPKHGGIEKHVIRYTLWPGVPAVVNGETFTLQPS